MSLQLERVGDDSAPAAGKRRAWGRIVSVDRDIRQSGTASPESSGRRTGFQAGTDLWASTNWRAGVYVGQLDGEMNVFGFASGIPGLAAGSNAASSARWHTSRATTAGPCVPASA